MSNTDGGRFGSIEIAKHALNFSVAHFTIFSKTERENLHGHNFQVACELTAPVNDDGLMFDYAVIKSVIRNLCDDLIKAHEMGSYFKKGKAFAIPKMWGV